MKIIAVSGSLRKESTNTRLVEAAKLVADTTVDIEFSDLIRHLPLFNPDLNPDQIEAVSDWVKHMREADALIVSTPEYARGYPGALKNAFDWLVQGDGFVAKPFSFFIASQRAEHSHKTLTTVLETMSGVHISEADVTIPLLGTNFTVAEIASNKDFSTSISTSLKVLTARVTAMQHDGSQ